MHCGWMPESEWLDVRPGSPDGVPKTIGQTGDSPGIDWQSVNESEGTRYPNVCPGWAARQPLVVEACQAFKAFDKGALDSFFPDIHNVLAEAILELARTFDEYSRQEMAAMNQRMDHG